MKRFVASVAAVFAVVAFAAVASAQTRQASIGNYYYEDDQQQDRTKITLRQGDQITFTVREGIFPPHTVEVDELDIHSGDIVLGQSYTTPALNKVGNFYLYCSPHEQRGHHARLIVLAQVSKPSATSPPPLAKARATAGPARPSAAPAATSTPAISATPRPTLAPVGIGTPPPGALDRPIRRDPDSLEALTGRSYGNGYPWTRSLWWLLIAAFPIIGLAALAIALERKRST